MHSLKKSFAAFLGLAALIGLITAATPSPIKGQGGAGAKDVNVVNTPTVSAHQSGAWSVSVAGTPTVSLAAGTSVSLSDNAVVVSNTAADPALVRTLDDSARRTKQGGKFVEIAAGSVVENEVAYTVPAGKRLVIEHVSVNLLEAQSAEVTNLWFETTTGNTGVQHLVPLPFAGSTMAGQPTRIYADEGTEVRVLLRIKSPVAGGVKAFFSYSGYLVDAQ